MKKVVLYLVMVFLAAACTRREGDMAPPPEAGSGATQTMTDTAAGGAPESAPQPGQQE